MPKLKNARTAFTLIEVMVAVLIVSVVIGALIEMQGNATHKFLEIKKMVSNAQYSSFLLFSSDKYGFDEKNSDMKTLLSEFELESDLRRRVKSMRVNIDYEELTTIDTDKMLESDDESYEESSETTESSGIVFEIGETILSTDEFTNKLIRVRIQ